LGNLFNKVIVESGCHYFVMSCMLLLRHYIPRLIVSRASRSASILFPNIEILSSNLSGTERVRLHLRHHRWILSSYLFDLSSHGRSLNQGKILLLLLQLC